MPGDIFDSPAPRADARLAYGSDSNQFLDLRLPSNETRARSPLVINIHGGFWRARYSLDHAGHLCAALTAKGLATANLEYRRLGNDGGGWPGTFSDVRSAYNFLLQNSQAYNLDLKRIVVMGHSAGGQLAMCLAGHEAGVTRVISLAGVVDLRRAYHLHLSNDAVVEFLHGTPAEVPDHYREADPLELSIPHARQWLIHGSADDTVPPAFSRDYVAAKRKGKGNDKNYKDKEDAHLLEIPGAGHFDLIDPRAHAWKRVEETVIQLIA